MIKTLPSLNNTGTLPGKDTTGATRTLGRFVTALVVLLLIGMSVPVRLSAADPVATNKVTLDMRNATLTEVFAEIERQSGIVFVSSADDMRRAARTDARYTDMPVKAVLDDLLRDQQLDYKVTEDYVTIFARPAARTAAAAAPEPVQVSGQVLGTTGEPMISVNVLEKGTYNGVVTGSDGRFTINISRGDATLQFSMLGYRTVEVPVAGRSNVTVTLEEVSTGMEEVIVVAYGVQRKSSVTGSITTVKASDLTTVTSPNVNTMLQGKVAGVQVTNTSGKPGEAARIRIRGKGSMMGEDSADPLWVIDGVISGTGSQLNPNDIESMSILKDASATALYGSRATNGVILVTTKSGRAGENRVDVSAKFGVAYQNLGNFRLMNSRELYDYTMSMDRLPDDSPWLFDREKLLSHDTDWFDFATRTGFSQNYTVSHTMGTEKVRNFISGDYYREQGSVRGFTYERFSIRDNIDIKLNDRLNIHFRVAASFMDSYDKQHDLVSAMNNLPWDYPYNEDGTIRTGKEDDWHGREASNYLYNTSLNWDKTKQLGVNGSFAFDYRITNWLTFESNNNIGYRFNKKEAYVDPNAIGAQEYHGSIENDIYFVTTRYTNQLLRFNRSFEQKHLVSAFLGYEFSDYFFEQTQATGRSLSANTEVLGVAASPYAVGGNKYGNAIQSAYFNANYTYDDRYNAQFSFRTDGSSKFGPDKRYGYFWTVGLGWSVDKEEFMRSIDWVDFLKLRGSYGSIGNQAGLGNYNYLSTYGLDLAYNGIPAAFPNVMGNRYLTWEKCYEANVGIDARFFDRLGVVVDFYNKNTSDLLYNAQLSALTGFKNQYQNIGSLRNRGVEITLSPEIIKTREVLWTMDINFGINRNKVTGLAHDDADQISNIYIYRVGYDKDSYFLPEWAGVDVYSGQPMWYHISETTGERSLVTDISQATRVISGASSPKWYGGIHTAVSYKGFTLSAMGNFVYGNKIFHYARQFYDNDGAYPTYNAISLKSGQNWKRWEKPGDIATHPQPIWGGNNKSNENSTRFLEDGSFFRLNNLSLTYDLPSRWTDKLMLGRGQIYVSAENLFTITRFSGADPEIGAGANNGSYDLDVYPAARRFSFGINFSF